MVKQSKLPTAFTDNQLRLSRETNWTIGEFAALEFRLQRLGHYDFQQKVRELEEQFRSKTGRKEKD